MHLRSSSWTSWKFFTEGCVTRPWKLSTYDWVSVKMTSLPVWERFGGLPSLHTGVLFCKAIKWSMFRCLARSSKLSDCCEESDEDRETKKRTCHSPHSNGWRSTDAHQSDQERWRSFFVDLWIPRYSFPSTQQSSTSMSPLHRHSHR